MQDFLKNVSRYPRFLISFTLGIFLVAFSPLQPLFKRPSTAVLSIAVLIAAFIFIALTLRAMLGLSAASPA